MGRKVDIDDLADAADVARVLGLADPKAVHVYASRYPDMPKPVVDRGPRRTKLWLRSEVESWQRRRKLTLGP